MTTSRSEDTLVGSQIELKLLAKLEAAGIETFGHLAELSSSELRQKARLGRYSVHRIERALKEQGLRLKPETKMRTPEAIARFQRVLSDLSSGISSKETAKSLGVSKPRVSQLRREAARFARDEAAFKEVMRAWSHQFNEPGKKHDNIPL